MDYDGRYISITMRHFFQANFFIEFLYPEITKLSKKINQHFFTPTSIFIRVPPFENLPQISRYPSNQFILLLTFVTGVNVGD